MKKHIFYCIVIVLILLSCTAEHKVIAYKTLPENKNLSLKVYRTMSKVDTQQPCVVFLSGGGWEKFSWSQHNQLVYAFSNVGIKSIVVEYRTSNNFENATPFNALEDVQDALAYIRANHKRYKINPSKIIAIGSSAGGHLAFASSLPSDGPKDKVTFSNTSPNFIVAVSPVLRNDEKGFGHEKVKEEYKWFSPYNSYLENDIHFPPALIISGEKDNLIKFSDLETLELASKKRNDDLTLIEVKGVGHSMIKYRKDIYDLIFKETINFFNLHNIPYNNEVYTTVFSAYSRLDSLNFYTRLKRFK